MNPSLKYLAVSLALVAAACGGAEVADPAPEATETTTTTEAIDSAGQADDFPRTFSHGASLLEDEYYGHLPAEVVIPERPERIVTLAPGEYTDALLALGIPPVASGTYATVIGATDDPEAWPPAIYEEAVAAGIPSVGRGWEPDIEAILQADPDLVVGSTGSADADVQISAIAPQIEPWGSRDWRDTFRDLAWAIGAEDRAEEIVAEWEDRAAAIGERFGPVKVALVRPRPDVIWVYGPPSNAGTILAEVGVDLLEAPEGSSITADAPGAIGEISLERLAELSDAEHLFVITYSVDEDQLQGYLDDPLWQQLPAAQAGNVHLVEGTAWTNHGPLGAHVVLDELETGLGGG